MALALVLLAGSGLMVRSFQALRSVDPGFADPEEVLTFRVTIPDAEVADPVVMAQTHQEILRRVQAVPGVASAALSSSVTMDGWDSNDPLESEDHPVDPGQLPPIRRYKWIGPGYFATMGNPMVAGRDLTWQEVNDRAKVVVLSENLARTEFGDPAAAIGKRVRQTGIGEGHAWYEVVGVSGDVRDDGASQDPVAVVYWPQIVDDFWGEPGPMSRQSMAYAVRAASGTADALLPAARRAVWSVNPNLPLARVHTLAELVAGSTAQTSFTLIMLAIAAAVALFLGAVGIYGVISYVVAQRTREIGVRMAMGAERGAVTRMVLRQAGGLALTGVAVGLGAAFGLTHLMTSLLFGVSPVDPATFGAVAALLALIALLASWIPAHRAASVDPTEALRAEV
jgi:predicted permease